MIYLSKNIIELIILKHKNDFRWRALFVVFIEINCWIRLGPGRRQPPAYSVAAQMARLHRLGRAHSHEGVTGVTQGYHYHTDPDTDQGTFSISKMCRFLNTLCGV